MSYHHNASNTCYFISLAYAFTTSGESNDTREIATQIKESLNCQSQGYKYRIAFANDIMSDQAMNPCEQRLQYNIKKWGKEANLKLFMTSVKNLPWYS